MNVFIIGRGKKWRALWAEAIDAQQLFRTFLFPIDYQTNDPIHVLSSGLAQADIVLIGQPARDTLEAIRAVTSLVEQLRDAARKAKRPVLPAIGIIGEHTIADAAERLGCWFIAQEDPIADFLRQLEEMRTAVERSHTGRPHLRLIHT